MNSDRLPHAVELENSIISTLLLYDTDSVLDIMNGLAPEDFYSERNRLIFSAAKALFSRNVETTMPMVISELREMGTLERAGGAAAIAAILDTEPVAVDVEHHIKNIKEKAILRQIIKGSSDLLRECSKMASADDAMAAVERMIAGIDTGESESTSRAADVVVDVISNLEQCQLNRGAPIGIPTGFDALDEKILGLQKTDLIIIAARPAMGKTALALNIAQHVAVNEGVPTAFFSLEMSKEQLMTRIVCSMARVDSHNAKMGMISNYDWQNITGAAEKISRADLYIDDNAGTTALTIAAKIRKMKRTSGIGLVIVDYIQLMAGGGQYERRDLEIGAISRTLKLIAKECGIPVIALSQLNRNLENRVDKRPTLADLRESGSIEQDADIVTFIYRDEVYNKDENNPNKGVAEIIVQKNRSGPIGTAYLHFDPRTTTFKNIAFEERC